MKKGHSVHVRFYPENELHKQAWDYLEQMDRTCYQNYNHVIAQAVVEYFERRQKIEADIQPMNEALLDGYVQQIVHAVDDALIKTLPAFLAGCLAISEKNTFDANGCMPDKVPNMDKPNVAGFEAINESDIAWDFLGG